MKIITALLSFLSIGNVSLALTTGEPHSTVQTLTKENFDEALNDPANGLWLLKFYAPWCSHCKKLAPTLDKMAPYLSGKLAIGKLDCTDSKTKPVCDELSVKGYPTLKIFRDGDFFDYPGKRDPDSMIAFAEKMSRPPVRLLSTPKELSSLLAEHSFAFLVYDSKAKSDTKNDTKGGEELSLVEKYLASTTALQVFGQVARKLQDRAHFVMMAPGQNDKNDLQQLGFKGKGPFIVKVEANVDPVVYQGKLNSMDVLDFVKENNVALVTDLQGHNFRTVANMGRPMFIGVVDSSEARREEMNDFSLKLMNYAKGGDAKEEYRFATMDGIKWSNFLKQFDITSMALPQLLVLDAPKRTYYRNDTIVDIEKFVQGIMDGTIEKQEQSATVNGGGALETFHKFFVKYMPYSIMVVVLIVSIMIYFALSDNEDEIRYQEMLKAKQERARKFKEQNKQKPVKED